MGSEPVGNSPNMTTPINRGEPITSDDSGGKANRSASTENVETTHQVDKQPEFLGISSELGQQTQDNLVEDIATPPLLEVVGMDQGKIDFLETLGGRYDKDIFFKDVLAKPHEYKNFVVKHSLIFRLRDGQQILCIPSCIPNGRNVREIIISRAHSILAHLGTQKTISYLRDQVWWKSMNQDISKYCETCTTCK